MAFRGVSFTPSAAQQYLASVASRTANPSTRALSTISSGEKAVDAMLDVEKNNQKYSTELATRAIMEAGAIERQKIASENSLKEAKLRNKSTRADKLTAFGNFRGSRQLATPAMIPMAGTRAEQNNALKSTLSNIDGSANKIDRQDKNLLNKFKKNELLEMDTDALLNNIDQKLIGIQEQQVLNQRPPIQKVEEDLVGNLDKGLYDFLTPGIVNDSNLGISAFKSPAEILAEKNAKAYADKGGFDVSGYLGI